MIDFQNASFLKMRKVNNKEAGQNVLRLLVQNEGILSVYKGVRDYVVFTNKRVITVNVQGITGKKQDYMSIPYSKIMAFSIETAGTFDLDSELEIYLSGVGKVKFEFSGQSDIVQIGQIISAYLL